MMRTLSLLPLLALFLTLGLTAQVSPKRGMAYGNHTTQDLDAVKTGISWWYNWSSAPESAVASYYASQGVEFVPMIWDENFTVNDVINQIPAGAKYLLAFNEPNFNVEANLTPAQAASHWSRVEQVAAARNLEIVSAAAAYCGGSVCVTGYTDPVKWHDDFFAACPTCKVDYIAFHCYETNASGTIALTNNLKKYNRPIWVTEFACWDPAQSATFKDNYLKTVVDAFEADPDIYRYSWFTGRRNDNPSINLLGANGVLTSLGTTYINRAYGPKVNIPGKVEAENHYRRKATGLETCTDAGGTQNVGWTDPGDWMEYLVNVNASGNHTFEFRVASLNTTSTIRVKLDGTIIKSNITISPTGGYQTWANVSVPAVPLNSGEHLLKIEVVSGGGFNLNYFNTTFESGLPPVAEFTASPISVCTASNVVFSDNSTGKTGTDTYTWNFGSGASPATATGLGPHTVTYSTGGQKTITHSITNANGTNSITKTDYVTVNGPNTGCLFSDDFNNSSIGTWITPIPGAFTHTEAGTAWTISNGGYGEWENFKYTLNSGTSAMPINFKCNSYKPVLKIRAKASANCLLAVTLVDNNGRAVDNFSGTNLELTNTYQTFTIDFTGRFRNYYSGNPGILDSSYISQLQFAINPGFFSYPITGTNGTYNAYFPGTVDIDWIGIGQGCNAPGSGPTITSFTPGCGQAGTAVTITGTNLSSATSVTFNGVAGTITSNTATQIVVNAPAGVAAGNIVVTTAAGTATSATTFKISPTTSAITGNATVCAGTTGVTYSVTNTAGSSYAWTVPTGATVTAGGTTNSITVTFGTTSGNVAVTETNSAGCAGTQVTRAVTVNAKPTTSAITGSATVCANASGVAYSVTNTVGSTYAWTVPTGASISGSGAAITVTFGTASGNVAVTETNSNGCAGTQVTRAVTVNAKPSTSAITGSATVCANASGVAYSVTNTAGSTYAWTVPTGASISGSGAAITVMFGTASGNVAVTETNSAGCAGTQVTKAITVNAKPTTSAITGSASVCANATGVAYSVTNTAGSTYAWTVPAGASISGTGAAITVTFGTASGDVAVTETNSAGCAGTQVTKAITVNAKPSTSAITGNATVCAGATGVAYSVTNTAGSSYAWTVPTGASISGSGNAITVSFGTASGNVAVAETNSNACVGTQVTKAVTVNALPTTSAITGNATPSCGATGVAYSVTNTVGSSYAWTVPAGASISGSGASITVNFGTTNGNITVVETNAAGCAGAAKTLAITMSGCSLAADFTGSPLSVCIGETVTFTNTSTGTTGSTTYSWNFGTGASPGTATGAGPHNVTYSSSGAKTVSLQVTDGASNTNTKTNYITVNTSAVTSSITGSASVCANGSGVSYSVTNTAGSSYAWTVPSGATITAGGVSNSITVTFGATSGDVTVTETNAAGCEGTEVTKAVTINTLPSTSAITGIATVCSGAAGVTYFVTTTAGSSYAWTLPSGATIASGGTSSAITVNFGTSSGDISVVETNAASCAGTPVIKTVTVTTAPTTAYAGSDQNVTTASATLAGNTPSVGTGTWTKISGSGTISNANDPASAVTDLSNGTSIFRWTIDNNGCTSFDEVVLNVSIINGTEDAVIESYQLYPNPFSDVTTLKINTSKAVQASIRLVDARGVVMYQANEVLLNEDIKLGSGLTNGIYTVIVTYGEKVSTYKITKTE